MYQATSKAELLIEQLWEQYDDIDVIRDTLKDAMAVLEQDIKQLEENERA